MLPELMPNMFQSEDAAAALRRTVAQHLVHTGSLETAEVLSRVRTRSYFRYTELLTCSFRAGIRRISASRTRRDF